MVFEPGNSYYMLTPDQMTEMTGIMSDLGYEFDLVNDFQVADDGNYYCIVGGPAIDGEELGFMEDFGFSNPLVYNKSVQSTSFY